MKKYSRPILAQIFDLIGALCFIVGGLVIAFAFFTKHDETTGDAIGKTISIATGVSCIVVGLVYIGFGQVVDYLGRTAHNTSLLVQLATKSAETSAVTAVATQAIATSVPVRRQASKFYYATNGTQEGPFDAQDIQGLVLAGTITKDTPVIREGDSEWRTPALYPELR